MFGSAIPDVLGLADLAGDVDDGVSSTIEP